jgi:transcriptional regulator with XRE-family HTH domain
MNKLKELIESRSGSVNKFCDSIDNTLLSKQTVYKLLNNKKPNPTLSTLLALSNFLQINIVDLIEIFKQIQPTEDNLNGIN